MSTACVLNANLAHLRARHPALAAEVERADASGVEMLPAREGGVTLRAGGVLLASSYDPAGEAAQTAEQMAKEPGDFLVALGFGLGLHLEAYLRLREVPILIFEPCGERLRAGLSAGHLHEWMEDPRVHWARDLAELTDRFASLYTPGLHAQVYVHPALLRLVPETVRTAVETLRRCKDAIDVDVCTRISRFEEWSQRTVENLPHLLSTPSLSRLHGAFSGVPAVVAAAGPSLERQLPALAEAADRVLVIAIGQSLRALRQAGIEPHLVHVIDSPDVSHQIVEAGDSPAQNLVLFPSVHPRLYDLPVRSRFVAYPVTNRIACWIAGELGESGWVFGGGTVAQSAVHIAVALGANPICLIGQDLAFTGGRVYASGSAYDGVSFRRLSDGRFVYTHFDEKLARFGKEKRRSESDAHELVWVEGWHGERLPTSRGYASFIHQYGRMGEYLASQGIRLVNCTEGGARIPFLEHRSFAELLTECARAPVPARERIQVAFDAAPAWDAQPLRAAVTRSRRALCRLTAEVKAGLERAERAPAELRRARNPERQIQVLRSLGRSQRGIQRKLAGLFWIDDLSEAERHRSQTRLRQASSLPPREEAVETCRLLLECTQRALERADRLLDRMAELLPAPAEPASGRRSAGRRSRPPAARPPS